MAFWLSYTQKCHGKTQKKSDAAWRLWSASCGATSAGRSNLADRKFIRLDALMCFVGRAPGRHLMGKQMGTFTVLCATCCCCTETLSKSNCIKEGRWKHSSLTYFFAIHAERRQSWRRHRRWSSASAPSEQMPRNANPAAGS